MFKRRHSEPINTRNTNKPTRNNPFELLAEEYAKDRSDKDDEEEREVVKARKCKETENQLKVEKTYKMREVEKMSVDVLEAMITNMNEEDVRT